MNNSPILNQRMVRKNRSLKRVNRAAKHHYQRGSRQLLKNYIAKVIELSSTEAIHESEIEKQAAPSIDIKEDALLQAIDSVNLTGMSGNGFYVATKIRTVLEQEKQKRVLIVNVVECEPGLLHDEWLLKKYPSEIEEGIHYIQTALNIDKTILASKVNTNHAFGKSIVYHQVPARYPMGEEHFLIQELLGLKLEKKEIPAKKGILVMNVQTIYQIYKLMNGQYEEGHYVTLANLMDGSARISYVTNQDNVKQLLTDTFGCPEITSYKLYAGSGVMGAHPISDTEVFTGTISFAAIADGEMIDVENKCKGCGRCTRHCPMGIDVRTIVRQYEKEGRTELRPSQYDQCIGCGTCTYFCRASKNISAIMKELNAQA